MDDLTCRLWEVDENLCRAELTELERAEHLAQRKEIYEQLHPEARHHVSGAVAANAVMGRGTQRTICPQRPLLPIRPPKPA